MKLALSVPGYSNVVNNPTKFSGQPINSFGSFASVGLELAFFVAAFMFVAWLFWGIFQYIFSAGDKAKVGQARNRITFALIGFFIVILAFTIQKYVIQIIGPQYNANITATPVNP